MDKEGQREKTKRWNLFISIPVTSVRGTDINPTCLSERSVWRQREQTLHTCLDVSLRVWVDSLSSSAFLFLLPWFAAVFKQRLTNLMSVPGWTPMSNWSTSCIFVANFGKCIIIQDSMLVCFLFCCEMFLGTNQIWYIFQNNFYIQHHTESWQTCWLNTFLLCLLSCCRLFSLHVCEHFVRKCLRYSVRRRTKVNHYPTKQTVYSCWDVLKWTVIKLGSE